MAKKFFTLESLTTFVDEIKAYVTNAVSGKANSSHTHSISNVTNLQNSLDAKVPTSRKVNGKALSSDITLTASDVGASASGHTHSSYVNQNAFSNVKVGTTTVAADTTTDTLEIAAGTGISVSGDATNDKVTITNSGVRSIATGSANGTISVNTNGTSADVAVKGLGSAAYKATTAFDASGTAQTKADSALASAKTYTDEKIALLMNNSSEAVDSIMELATAMEENEDVVAALNTAVGTKVDKVSGKGLSTNDLTATLKSNYDTAYSHVSNKNNPHGVTLSQLGVTATAAELNYMDGVTSNVQTQLDGKSASGHTHKYAGSSSAGGAATSANKLNTDKGSATHPVYFENGVPVETTYTLGKSVPSDAKFTDTTYSVATDSANGLMASTDKAKSDATNVAYGTCSTAAATAAKVVSVSGNTNWKLAAGSVITVLFTNTNTAENPTLNVNSTGAKNIYYGSAQITTSNLGYAGTASRPMTFMYDGTQYRFIGWGYDANTTYTNVELGHGYCTCSTAAATVAKTASLSSYTLATGGIVAVKFTYDVPASATLNINSKGAKAIYYKGAAITAGVIKAGDTATFIYSTNYHLISLDRDTTYEAAGSSLGLVKSGGDVTISSGVITVNDDSHNHTIANVDNLQTTLDGKAPTSHASSSTTYGTGTSSNYGHVKLSDSTSSTSSTSSGVAATPAAVKAAYDLANGKADASHTHTEYASKSLYDTRTINVGRKSGTNTGSYSLAFGSDVQASASFTQSFGANSVASGFGAHAEGTNYRENNSVLGARTVELGGESYTVTGTTAKGGASHAEGVQTFALGYASHSEGYTTTAGGEASHAEGCNTMASGNWSHSEGEDTVASAIHSHAEGYGTIAASIQQHVQGKYNIADTEGEYLHIVGNGDGDDYRSNAHTLDWDGNAWFAGDVTTAAGTSLNTHSHAWSAITGKPDTFAPSSHSHAISDVSGLQSALDGKAASSHSHAWSAITGKPSTFTPSSHSHAISDISGLQSALNGKASSSHNHSGVYASASHTHDYLPLSGGTLTGAFTVNDGIHIGGSTVGSYPYIYNSGKVLYIRCGNTYWAFGETGITKNGTVKVQ